GWPGAGGPCRWRAASCPWGYHWFQAPPAFHFPGHGRRHPPCRRPAPPQSRTLLVEASLSRRPLTVPAVLPGWLTAGPAADAYHRYQKPVCASLAPSLEG